MSIEKWMQEWMALHGEEPYGRHWKADIHRRFDQASRRHRCTPECRKRGLQDRKAWAKKVLVNQSR